MDDLSKLAQSAGAAAGAGGADPGDATAGDPSAAIASLVGAVQDEGGLDALVGKLQAAGLGGAVDTWVGGGPNQALEPAQLRAALGDDEVQRLSAKSGLDIAALLPLLAAFLPQIVNMLTPNGTVPEGGLNDAATQGIPDLGGLLGGILGGAGATGGTGGTAGLDDLLGGLGGMLGGNKPG